MKQHKYITHNELIEFTENHVMIILNRYESQFYESKVRYYSRIYNYFFYRKMFFGQGKYVNLSHFTKTDTVVFSFYYIKSNNMSEVTITFDGFRYKRDIKGNIMNIGVL